MESSVANPNTGDGIQCANACRIFGYTARLNGGDGVEIVASGAVVLGNELSGYTGPGLRAATDKVLSGRNNLTGNLLVPIVVPGTSLGDNLCTQAITGATVKC